MERKDTEFERTEAREAAKVKLAYEHLLIREGEAVICQILTRHLKMSIVEAEMMLEPYIKGEQK